jgi:signal transduction histidine kinase/CheY-like chemotaxis protein/HPt (histidine-containing phosphotransfer) domain-containing protein
MAMTLLPETLRQTYQWGVTLSPDPRRAKRIYLSNRIAAVGAFSSLFYAILYPFIGLSRFSGFSLVVALAFAIIPLLNRRGRTWFSRVLLVAISDAAVIFLSMALGKESGFHLFLLPTAWLVLVVFDAIERNTMVWGIGLNSIALLCLEAFAPQHGMLLALEGRNGRILHFTVVATVQVVQIVVVYYFFLANRITETALAEAGEAARAADKAKSQFLANMSHEIRTPLNGILGMSSLLMKSGMREEQKDLVQAIQSSGLDLMIIIGEILDLSKIEAGKMRIESAPFEMAPLLESILRPFEHEAKRKRLSLRLDSDPGIPQTLIGDAIRLKQVLNNLLGHALKFTQSGGITLRLRCSRPEQASPAAIYRLRFEVEDTGIGIPEDAQGRIFQAFSQAEQSASRRYGGTGLGLFISKQILSMMGGTIGFRTRRGEGTVFHFEIPFPAARTSGADAERAEGPGSAPASRETVAAGPSAKPAAKEQGGGDGSRTAYETVPGTLPSFDASGPRLLIVEDHPLNQKVFSGFLSQSGFSADVASGGREALKLFALAPYDMIFMDCHMPGMDGLECTRALREMRFPGKRPTIIGVTADAMIGTREKCLEAGMDDVITKPILADELQAALSRWLGAAKPAAAVPDRGKLTASVWVDLSHLKEMDEWIRVYDPGFWDRAQEQFRDSSRRLIDSIRNGFEAGNIREAAESSHSLKGLCLMLGFSRMAESCKALEAICADGKTGWEMHITALEESMEPSMTEMRRQVGQI